MSVLLEFAMFPTDKGESVSAYVSQVIKMIRESGADYQLTPMGTIIETPTLKDAMALVENAYAILEKAGCNRIYSSLKLDIRIGKENRLKGKIASIQEKIGDVVIPPFIT
ncbi:MTH1187 family thiamine-binding protein [Candidatus Vondammii sp. HM_W22]|uniref:MTH1187 family thiamine-binding protein n=1 Tax=Candidatus Vondammii sp. HM_W22 TaxID=2687299 RepID=UPI001F13ED88|nr:MTH1187 family thiamine-binding protein [Candidatus Vondammii sp. HM_W22]